MEYNDDGLPKKLSGAAYRKARKKRDKAATKNATARGKKQWAKRYQEIGAPPADGALRVEWGNRISAEIAYEQLIAPAVRAPGERRLVLEAIRTLGMTAVKALYEERLRKLEAKVYKRAGKDPDASDDGLEVEEP